MAVATVQLTARTTAVIRKTFEFNMVLSSCIKGLSKPKKLQRVAFSFVLILRSFSAHLCYFRSALVRQVANETFLVCGLTTFKLLETVFFCGGKAYGEQKMLSPHSFAIYQIKVSVYR
jgi:hypothetical protein